jgi:hypothetical protein
MTQISQGCSLEVLIEKPEKISKVAKKTEEDPTTYRNV